MHWLTPTTSSQCSNLVSYFGPLFWTLPCSSYPSNRDLQRTQFPRHIFAIFEHASHTQIRRTTCGCYPRMESSSYSKEPSSSLTMQMSVWTSYDPTTTIASQGIQALARRLVTPVLLAPTGPIRHRLCAVLLNLSPKQINPPQAFRSSSIPANCHMTLGFNFHGLHRGPPTVRQL